MKAHLQPCPTCARHVRTSERRCPFCLAALPGSLRGAAPPPLPAQRLGRAALMAFGLLAAPACTDDALSLSDAGTGGAGGGMSAGGSGGVGGDAAPVDAARDGARPVDGGSIGPVYGAPVPRDAADAPVERPRSVPVYGAPTPSSGNGGRRP